MDTLSTRTGEGTDRLGWVDHVRAVLVRVAVLGVALTAYTQLVVPRTGDGGDAAIGAGLLAFAALALAGFCGCLVDTVKVGAVPAVAWWAVVAAVLAVGWWVALAVPRDTSMSFTELLAADAGQPPFTFGLVAAPAVLGAVVGAAVSRRPLG
ncbi:hypothetical protein AAII07_16060 [Microvirga sp. 0TCS3.31]